MINDNDGDVTFELTQPFIDLIDKAIMNDFIVKEITEEDRKNIHYQALKDTLHNAYQTVVLYERRVFSQMDILPKLQYLFGFKPRDGICLFLNKPMHKVIACRDLAKLNQGCFLVNKFQFLLTESDADKTWCFVPLCPCEDTCELVSTARDLRTRLWVEDSKPVDA
nr:hypothetical protein [Candidatus Sigynarchaeota archaeon]